MDSSVIFDPKIFHMLNSDHGKQCKNKMQLYKYYLDNRGYLYSNLNLNPIYHGCVRNILRLDSYRKFVGPVKDECEMYRDLIFRLQYTTDMEVLISTAHPIHAHQNHFFRTLARKYFGTDYFHCLKAAFQREYSENAITTIVERIHSHLESLVKAKQGVILADLNCPKPVLLIRCYEMKYVPLINLFFTHFDEQYLVLIDHFFFLGECAKTNLNPANLSYNYFVRLASFYHFSPRGILYIGDLSSLKEAIIGDRQSFPKSELYYFLDRCCNIPLYLVPLIRGFDRVFFRSKKEISLLAKSRLFHQTRVRLTEIPLTMTGSKGPVKSPAPDAGIIRAYGTSFPGDTFIEWCRGLEQPVRFAFPLPLGGSPLHSHNVEYCDLTDRWRDCDVYLETDYCVNHHVYSAMLQKQLLLLPMDNCLVDRTIRCFNFRKARVRGRQVGDQGDETAINPQNSEIDFHSLTEAIASVCQLMTVRNLDNCKKIDSIVRHNLELVISRGLKNLNKIEKKG